MKAEDIFLAAVEKKTPAERQSFLDVACGGDADLRSSVLGLLHSHDAAGSFLNAPLFGSAATTDGGEYASKLPATKGDEFPLDFLAPAASPGGLGRIGPYEVTARIGRGGMGLVLKALDSKLNRVVAVKVLAPELATNPTARKRFQREAHAAAAVVHQHVVTIHAVDEDRLPYLVMEYIDGQSLQQKIDRSGHLELKEILRIGQQIASGLAAAHAQGLMHRDVKPANILLENGVERVRITDFGLARTVDDVDVTRTGEVAGTPQYMSPEQAQGLPMDAKSDLFSLGCVLYAMCTGRSPFRAQTALATVRRVCEDTPRPLREVNPEIPAWLVENIDRLLAKQPAERFGSAAEVAELLGRRLAEVQHPSFVSPAADRPKELKDGRKSSYRGKAASIAATVLVLLLGGLSVTEATGVTKLTATVIHVTTGEGTLVVKVDDPTIKVTVDGRDIVIADPDGQEVCVRPGQHQVVAMKDGQPVTVDQPLVTITRGGREVVSVTPVPSASRPGGTTRNAPPPAIAPFDAAAATAHQEAWVRHLGVPLEFTNTVGMKFRLIPPGEFEMGSTSQAMEAARAADKYSDNQAMSDAISSEGPLHKVILSEPFYLGVTEVTQQEFETVTGRNPSSFGPAGASAGKVRDIDTSLLPVQGLSWNDAAEFCSRLSLREELASNYRLVGTAVQMLPGNGYRLPREGQWEFACRAGTTTLCWFGDQAADHADREWLRANSEGRPHRVASLVKNPFGLFDMHGNVSEWCQDGWNPEFYLMSKDRPAVDPLSKPQGPHQHMVRGGAWDSQPAVRGRSAFRMPAVPSKQYESNGLRVTLSVDSARRVIARQRSTTSPPTIVPSALPRLAPGAFVVLGGAGVPERKFDTLDQAVQRASDGDTIEIRGNGPFVVEPMNVGTNALILRAGTGFRPVLKPSQLKVPLLESSGRLVLEGVDFEVRGPNGPGATLILNRNGPLFVANCSICNEHRGEWQFWGLGAHAARNCTIRNCFFAGSMAGVGCDRPLESGTCTIENCILGESNVTGGSLNQPDLRDLTFRLRSCTVVRPAFGLIGFTQTSPMDLTRFPKPIRIEALGNVFDSDGVIEAGRHPLDVAAALERTAAEGFLRQLVDWHDQGTNVYANDATTVFYDKLLPKDTPFRMTLEEWNTFWGESNSQSLSGTIRFAGGNIQARLRDPKQLTPEDFRLRDDSAGYRAGTGGKDLGADVDLVGPGPAYEQWKKTPAYQKWLAETGQLKERGTPQPETGAFVLLAAGMERKFDTLAGAVQFASTGDTIEVRGNGPFLSEPINCRKTSLTIRAADGFRPVIKLRPEALAEKVPLLETNAELVLEGLELHRAPGKSNRMALQSRESPLRAANCRFRAPVWSGQSPICTFHNCEFLADQAMENWQFDSDSATRVNFENCVFRTKHTTINSFVDALRLRDVSMQVKRSTFVAAQSFQFALTSPSPTGEAAAPIRVEGLESIFDVPGVMAFQQTQAFLDQATLLEPDEAERTLARLIQWRGEHNLFAAGGASIRWIAAQKLEPAHGPKGMNEWKRFWGAAEVGSLEGRVRFRGGSLLERTDLDQLTPDDFRLREDSPGYRAGKDGKDLGADVDLVGPGPAYERWKQTPEYQEWRARTGQAVKAE